MAKKMKKKPAKRKPLAGKRNYDGVIGYWTLVFAILFFAVNMIAVRVSMTVAEDAAHVYIDEAESKSIETVKNLAIQKPEESGKCNFGANGAMPYMISVPKLRIDNACVEKMPSGDYLGDPEGVWNFGWYAGSAYPTTEDLGVYVCHTGFGIEALCNNFAKLQADDEIIITTGSGRKMVFYVRAMESEISADQPVDVVNRKLFTPYISDMAAVNFMTCSGSFVNGHATERTIVYATM